MNLTLKPASADDGRTIWEMQVRSFRALLEKYQDWDTSPAAESVERVQARLAQPFTHYYFLCVGEETVGVIRIVDGKELGRRKRISPLFVLPEYRNRGIAQAAIREAERIHGSRGWELDTIAQEAGNCHLYEKMGYTPTGKREQINHNLTLVFYQKD